MMQRKRTTDAVKILRRRFFERKPEMLPLLEEERANAAIARKIYELRTAAGFTQEKLAKRLHTTTSVISRLEDSDYEGHSLSMLRRVATALDTRLELRFAPIAGAVSRAAEATRRGSLPRRKRSRSVARRKRR
jgi:transcriptional regulator with XRE-family HTH domain